MSLDANRQLGTGLSGGNRARLARAILFVVLLASLAYMGESQESAPSSQPGQGKVHAADSGSAEVIAGLKNDVEALRKEVIEMKVTVRDAWAERMSWTALTIVGVALAWAWQKRAELEKEIRLAETELKARTERIRYVSEHLGRHTNLMDSSTTEKIADLVKFLAGLKQS